MNYTNFIRGLVKKNPQLKLKLKQAGSKMTPHQYMHQTISMTAMSILVIAALIFMVFNEDIIMTLILEAIAIIVLTPFAFKFWIGYVDVQIAKYGRELDRDLLFVSEYLLVTLESGLPLGNAIKQLSSLDRPGGKFFKRIYTDFKTGKDLEKALEDAAQYSASSSLKILLKRLRDSLNIGVDLTKVLNNFVEESSEKKILEIKAYSKKLNPIVMLYLLFGIVVPSLGVTFLIIGISIAAPGSPELLKYILVFIFMIMFTFQYFAYSTFKFSRSTL